MAKAVTQATNPARITLGAAVTAKTGDLIGWDGTQWTLADADARIPAQFMAMDSQLTAGGVVDVCQAGILFDDAAPFTAGADQYLSATPAAMTSTIPAVSATLTILQRIGKAIATDTVVFDLNLRGPRILRASVAVDPASAATDTVQNLAVTLTGILSTDYAYLAKAPAVVQGVIYNGSVVCTTNTVTIGIANASAGTVDGASTSIELIVERY